MRLGQLARKLSLRSADIVSFLASRNITIEEGTNTRVEDAHEKLVLEHFAPHFLQEQAIEIQPDTKENEVAAPRNTIADNAPEEASELYPSVDNDSNTPTTTPALETSDPAEAQTDIEELIHENGVIKAPKIELKGLKVLGKIDLPEPKKKEDTAQEMAQTPDGETLDSRPAPLEQRREKKPVRSTNPKDRRPAKNPIALQRERQAREEAERKRKALEDQKQKKKQHYHSKVKPQIPTKAVKIVNEPLSRIEHEQPDEPKTWWGKFMKWLTSY